MKNNTYLRALHFELVQAVFNLVAREALSDVFRLLVDVWVAVRQRVVLVRNLCLAQEGCNQRTSVKALWVVRVHINEKRRSDAEGKRERARSESRKSNGDSKLEHKKKEDENRVKA
jgi:flagellar biosynthesis regulator FlbT